MTGTRNIRAALFADGPNLDRSYREEFGGYIDYQSLQALFGDYTWVRKNFYLITNGNGSKEKLTYALRQMTYDVIEVKVSGSADSSQHDVDVPLAVHAMALADKIDVFILGSGDGDYLELVKVLQARGVRVIVAGVRRTTSFDLIQAADEFVPLNGAVMRGAVITNKQPV